MPVNVAKSLEWLAMLYGRTEAGWINLFSVEKATGRRRVEWAPADNLKALGPAIEDMGARGDVWFGAAPRAERLDNGARGGVSTCDSIPAFWLDIDIAGPAHKLPGLPRDKQEGIELIKRFPLSPSAVVYSGYGMQPWWWLQEPIPAGEAIPLLTRWQFTWEKIADQMGLHVDNVSNIDRVMRLPGTFNFKLDPAVPVYFDAKWSISYNASDIDDFFEPMPTQEQIAERLTSSRHLAGSRFNEVVTCGAVLKSFGWTMVRRDRRSGSTFWRHPKATNEVSAEVYADEFTRIYSETAHRATGIPLNENHSAFSLYTWLGHRGKYSEARADLLERGFQEAGESRPRLQKVKVAGPGKKLKTQLASEVNPVHPTWIWPGWLPMGKLVVLEGDPATGKSTVALDLLARITTGKPMPDGSPGILPSNVLFMSAEDDMDDTTVWRLRAAGANLERVIHVQSVFDDEDGESPLVLPLDTVPLWEKVEQTRAVMLVVDVLSAYLGGEVDTHKDAHVRRALTPLVDMAQATRVIVVLIRHLRKERAGKAIYQGNGSIGIAGVARAVHSIGYHPDNEAIRVLAPVKVNTAERPKALQFRLAKHPEYPCAVVEWGGEIDISADELVNAGPSDPDSALGQCRAALITALPPGKEMKSEDLMQSLIEAGFSRSTIMRARGKENVQVRPASDPGSGVIRGWISFRLGTDEPVQMGSPESPQSPE